MRNLQRHKVVVARQEGANEADITYYHVDMFVQAPSITLNLIYSDVIDLYQM